MALFHGHSLSCGPSESSEQISVESFVTSSDTMGWGWGVAHVCTCQCETYYNSDFYAGTTNNMACSASLLESKGWIFIQGQSPIYDCLDWTSHFPSWTWFLLSIYFPKDGGRDEVLSTEDPVSVQSAHFAWWMMSTGAKYSLLTASVTIYFVHCSLV